MSDDITNRKPDISDGLRRLIKKLMNYQRDVRDKPAPKRILIIDMTSTEDPER